MPYLGRSASFGDAPLGADPLRNIGDAEIRATAPTRQDEVVEVDSPPRPKFSVGVNGSSLVVVERATGQLTVRVVEQLPEGTHNERLSMIVERRERLRGEGSLRRILVMLTDTIGEPFVSGLGRRVSPVVGVTITETGEKAVDGRMWTVPISDLHDAANQVLDDLQIPDTPEAKAMVADLRGAATSDAAQAFMVAVYSAGGFAKRRVRLL